MAHTASHQYAVHPAAPVSTALLEWHGEPGGAKQTSSLAEGTGPASDANDEDLSDLDDSEAGMYLHTEEEAKLKEVIWTELNREFLDKQQVKAAAAAEHARKVCRSGPAIPVPTMTFEVCRIVIFCRRPDRSAEGLCFFDVCKCSHIFEEGNDWLLRSCVYALPVTKVCHVQTAAQHAAYGLAGAASGEKAEDAQRKKRPRGRPLGSKTKVAPSMSSGSGLRTYLGYLTV